MGTHAVYQIWVGVHVSVIEEKDLDPEIFALKKERFGPSQGSCEEIFMHGHTIGHGVLIHEMDWIVADDLPQTPDLLAYAKKAGEVRISLEGALRNRGLPDAVSVALFHHIDLGS